MPFGEIVVWFNLLFVSVGGVLSLVAAGGKGRPAARWLHGAVGAVCMIYVAGYVWLLGGYPERVLVWSEWMRGVALVAWITNVWSPAILSIRREQQEKQIRAEVFTLYSELEEAISNSPEYKQTQEVA